jgi:hypothetical protein
MLLTFAACALVLLPQDKPADKPAPADRSAEPVLRQMFQTAGALRTGHLVVTYYNRETNANRYDEDSSMHLWLGENGRFRLESSSDYWGGGKIVVSDGLAVLTDEMSDDGSIKLTKPYKAVYEASEEEPLLYFLAGDKGFDALVEKDKPVKFAPSEFGRKAIEFTSKKLGRIVVHYSDKGDAAFPLRIAQFKAPWWMGDASADATEPYMLQEIRVLSNAPNGKSLFSVAAPKGRKVVDERVKK